MATQKKKTIKIGSYGSNGRGNSSNESHLGYTTLTDSLIDSFASLNLDLNDEELKKECKKLKRKFIEHDVSIEVPVGRGLLKIELLNWSAGNSVKGIPDAIKEADVVLFIYDIFNLETFKRVEIAHKIYKGFQAKDPSMRAKFFLVGNKMDKLKRFAAEVPEEEVQKLAQENGMLPLQVSALYGTNMPRLVRSILREFRSEAQEPEAAEEAQEKPARSCSIL